MEEIMGIICSDPLLAVGFVFLLSFATFGFAIIFITPWALRRPRRVGPFLNHPPPPPYIDPWLDKHKGHGL